MRVHLRHLCGSSLAACSHCPPIHSYVPRGCWVGGSFEGRFGNLNAEVEEVVEEVVVGEEVGEVVEEEGEKKMETRGPESEPREWQGVAVHD